MRDFYGRPPGTVRSSYQQSRSRPGKLLHDLALLKLWGHRRTGTGVLLPLARSDQAQKSLARCLLIVRRKRLKGLLRRVPNGFSDPARARIGISRQTISLALIPGFLESVLQEREHALVLARLIEDALHQVGRIEYKSNFFCWLDNCLFQFRPQHFAKQQLTTRQYRFDLLMPNEGIIEVSAHGADHCNRRGSRCSQQQAYEAIDVSGVLCGAFPVSVGRSLRVKFLLLIDI